MSESADHVPYDRGWSWMVVLGINMMHVFLIGYIKTFGLLFVELQERFHLTSQQTAWVSTAMLLTVDVLSPLGTALGDRFGSRPVVMAGGLLVCISLCLSSFLCSIEYMIAIMGVLFGVGATLCYAPAMIMVGMYFKRRLGLANALAVTGSSVGQFILPPIVAHLLATFSLDGTLLILAAIMFNLSLAGALLRPATFYRQPQPPDPTKYALHSTSDNCPSEKNGEKSAEAEELMVRSNLDVEYSDRLRNDQQMDFIDEKLQMERESSSSDEDTVGTAPYAQTMLYTSASDVHCSMNTTTSNAIMHNMKTRSCVGFLVSIFDVTLLKNPVYTIFALGLTCVNFSYIGTFRYLPAHCKDIGINEQERAMMLSLVGMTDLIARLILAATADSLFIRKRIKRYRLLAMSLLLLSANGLLLVYSSKFWLLVLSCALYGVFGGVYMTLVSVSLVDLLGAKNLSRAWGIMLLLYSVTTIGEPLVLGHLRDVTGTYDASFLTCAALFLAGGLLVLLAPASKSCLQTNH